MSDVILKETGARERECVHRQRKADGDFYSGSIYIQALQRLSNEQAMRMAKNIGSLFWSDAPKMQVWLCQNCRHELGL